MLAVCILFVLGLCFGSFVNALVWRIHQQEKSKTAKSRKKYSIINGRSMCPHCKHELKWHDLIPLFSWLWLGGKCRYCDKPISAQYPLVELATGLIFVWSYLAWPQDLWSEQAMYYLVYWLVLSVFFMALAIYDLKWMLLPNKIMLPAVVFAAVGRLGYILLYENDIARAFLGWFLAVTVAGGIFFALEIVSGGKWIGGGDVNLGVLIGTVLASPLMAFTMIFLASVFGLIAALPSLKKNQGKLAGIKIPFGPYLILATFVVLLYGESLVSWYKKLVLLE